MAGKGKNGSIIISGRESNLWRKRMKIAMVHLRDIGGVSRELRIVLCPLTVFRMP